MKRRLLLVFPLFLAGCGTYPQPFIGDPGRLGAHLVVPPPPRLDVPAPATALLPQEDATAFAQALAQALAQHDVPAIAGPVKKGDWRLAVTADLAPGAPEAADPKQRMIAVTYTVYNPRGIAQGSTRAALISADTWEEAAPVALNIVAERDAPRIAALMSSIQAAVQHTDPDSLANREPKVDFIGVSGAPGDGDQSLDQAMVTNLGGQGIVVQDTEAGADFALKGRVVLHPGPKGQQRVEITWIVADLYGREVGHLVQMNDVPAGSLDQDWGRTAEAVAQQAAGGVKEAITNQIAARQGKTAPKRVAAHD